MAGANGEGERVNAIVIRGRWHWFGRPKVSEKSGRKESRVALSRCCISVLMVCIVVSGSAVAQWMGKQTGCYAYPIAANPNRPTVADPADITQYGVLEVEYGFNQQWPGQDLKQTSLDGLLKFGMLCDVELRWSTTSFISQTNAGHTNSGIGDNWLGPQIRFYRQTKRVPSLAFGYAVKIPSANSDSGLGSGDVDQAFTLLASKDVMRFHFDFNATEFLVGRTDRSGFDQSQQVNLAFSHRLHKGLQFTGEFYGQTQLNPATPGFASSLWALTYAIVPRLVIDGGYEGGLTSGGPQRHLFFGVTYSIANLYPGWKRNRPHTPAD